MGSCTVQDISHLCDADRDRDRDHDDDVYDDDDVYRDQSDGELRCMSIATEWARRDLELPRLHSEPTLSVF